MPDLFYGLGKNRYLHEIEAHGNQGHAQHEVHGAEDEAQLEPLLCRVDLVAGNEVTETDGAQRDEAEVGAVQELPILVF